MPYPSQITRPNAVTSRLIHAVILSAALLSASCAGTPVPGPEPAVLADLARGADLGLAAPGPYGVRTREARASSSYGKAFTFEVFEPEGSESIGTILIAHGFARNRMSMRGWGRHLAGYGFRAIVPDLVHSTPFSGRHERNARDLLDLARSGFEGRSGIATAGASKRAYLGFSAGGLASFVAFLEDPDASVWIGLDPVDSQGLARSALESRGAGAADPRFRVSRAFLGDPSSCNARGNFAPILESANIPVTRISGATHPLFEDPYDAGLEPICGRPASPEIRETLRDILRARVTGALLDAFLTVNPELRLGIRQTN